MHKVATFPNIVLSKKSAYEALTTLASYRSSITDEEIKKALTWFVVKLCEAMRFSPICAVINVACEDGGVLPQVGVALVLPWRNTSWALLVWNKDKINECNTIRGVIDKEIDNGIQVTSVEVALVGNMWEAILWRTIFACTAEIIYVAEQTKCATKIAYFCGAPLSHAPQKYGGPTPG
jgi:hypothetical protein